MLLVLLNKCLGIPVVMHNIDIYVYFLKGLLEGIFRGHIILPTPTNSMKFVIICSQLAIPVHKFKVAA